ncbi:MAG: hypothetical protein R3330_04765 [Saprospiraceae bacterium]|nr:hypothetical protein [Saprospiraceae bacterium]
MTLPTNIDATDHSGLTIDDHESYHDALHTMYNRNRILEENQDFILGNHGLVNVDTSSFAVTATLPDNAAYAGQSYIIRRDGANTVIIDRAGSDTFDDGDIQKTLDSDGATIGIFSIGDGEWKILAVEGTVGGS